MSNTFETDENLKENSNEPNTKEENTNTTEETKVSEVEIIPSMDEFKDQINQSFHKTKEGDIVKGTVIGVSDTEVTVDLGYYAEGIIKLDDLSNDPRFSIKTDITVGEEISAMVLQEDDGEGNILLSKKQAEDILSWKLLKDYLDNRTILKVKISQAVNGGVVTYVEGIRAFIPASQLSINYVEDLSSWVNNEISAIVITADENSKKLVLSGKEVERDHAQSEKKNKISHLPVGMITTGTVEKITPYGAFVNIGNGLSGLLHISQISHKRIKSPNEVIKEGQEVKVKIIDVKDGKISLSMKAVEEKEEVVDNALEVPFEYSSEGSATTGLGSLLSKIKL